MAGFEKDGGEDDAVTVEVKTDILLTLSALCEEDLHRKVAVRHLTGRAREDEAETHLHTALSDLSALADVRGGPFKSQQPCHLQFRPGDQSEKSNTM